VRTAVRNWLVFVISVLGVFWLQPGVPLRGFDFWLPLSSLTLCVMLWAATLPAAQTAASRRETVATLVVLAGLVLVISLTRFVEPLSTLVTRARPPQTLSVFVFLAMGAALAWIMYTVRQRSAVWRALLFAFLILLLLIKTEPLATSVSALLRSLQGQAPDQAGALDWRWLGISYLAFRMMSVLRERAAGRLPEFGLREFVSYAVFAPALQAGPIDRPDRFLKDLRTPFAPGLAMLTAAGSRLLVGAFKKYALADTLALVALNDANAPLLQPGWAWVPLYAYALRIYFDFSGYTDIALGVARLAGVTLPENFAAPYLKPNLTQFWNSWHISLAQWFRSYWFNPLTRALRRRQWEPAPIVLLGQVSTMLMIGLWHGVTANFVIWGLWHAAGLFVHNRWADFAKTRLTVIATRPVLQHLVNGAGALLTFHFVALGWVWFALGTPDAALQLFDVLLRWP
jgi:D-alanyl-lipoteichoic acid acyltransferase DltB (MBOAT superfamily)